MNMGRTRVINNSDGMDNTLMGFCTSQGVNEESEACCNLSEVLEHSSRDTSL